MKNKVSVIVPIYNVEKYLRKCIDSIINQTYSNLEIILVDDGSPDNCPSICDEYVQKDKRVRVIHKKNGGLSDARNAGMKIATGEWIAFIDSDDYVSNDYIEYLYNLTKKNNAEIGIVLPQNFFDGKKIKIKKTKEKIIVFNSKDALITMLYQKEFDTSAWGKIYKKELFNDIEFPYGKLYEDISTIYKTILRSKRVAYSNIRKYYYLQRKDSIMGQQFKIKDMDYVYQAEAMYNDIKVLNNLELERAAKCRVLNANFSILLKLMKNKEFIKEKNLIKFNINEYRKDIFINKNVRTKTKIACVLACLGII